jgi:hypothetical protein
MRMTRSQLSASWITVSLMLVSSVVLPPRAAAQGGTVGVGDIVQTAVNGQTTLGEVTRSGGGTVDLNLGQNNLSKFVQLQYVKVLQRAGTGETSAIAVGTTVQVPYIAGTVLSGRVMKVNGEYCLIDSSGSGFTGWNKCAELRVPGQAATGRAGASTATGASKPPKPGLVSCAGKVEGRYAPSSGLPGLTIVFKAGKATAKGPLLDDEEFECWTGNKKIYLHKPGEDDLEIDINDDGTLDTPLGELKKKSS